MSPTPTEDDGLSGLGLTGYNLSPSFDNSTYQYTADGTDASSTVTATPVNDTATVSATLNGEAINLQEPVDIPVGQSTLVVNTTEA